jgi:hypothetical protein
MHMVGGISKIPSDPGQIEHILRIALDGLRYKPLALSTRSVLPDSPSVPTPTDPA